MLIDLLTAMRASIRKIIVGCFVIFVATTKCFAQQELTSDELFTQARNIPKEKENYPAIIDLLKKALQRSPDYADIHIFLGRVYTWSDKLDSARYQFNQVLAKEPKNADALSANFDLEYWNDNYTRALDHANMGVLYYPDSSEFLLKKVKALNALKDHKQANNILKDYLKKHPEQDTVRRFYRGFIDPNAKNMIDLTYEYVYFDKRFEDPWHYISADYTRNTPIGSITGRINYANRFKESGWQGEVEAYPKITKGIYAYIGGAYSKADIFPRVRFGTSLYYTLPWGFDAETGFRYLNFNPTETYIYVLSLGKYVGNYYFNLRSYLSPDVDVFSHSYTLMGRYYFSDRYNFIGAQIGTGVSPDDRARNITGLGNLHTYKAGVNFAKDVAKNFTVMLSGVWYYEEFRTDTWGNQISGSISLLKRF